MWMPDSEKHIILPRTISLRRKLSIDVEMVCNVEEIAGGGIDTQIATLRETFLDFESSKRVAEKMEIQDIQPPCSRQDVAQKQVYGDLLNPAEDTTKALGVRHVMTTGPRRQWHNELKQLEQDYRDGKFLQYDPSLSPTRERPKDRRTTLSPEYFRLTRLRSEFKLQEKFRIKVDELIEEQDDIDRLHFGILNKAHNEPERQGTLAELQGRAAAFKTHLENLPKRVRDTLKNSIDNRRAFAKDPPLLMWDRRTAEPLIVHEDEFFKPTQLALLDFRPISPTPYPITSAQSAIFDLIMGGLLNHPNDTIYCLNSLAPGAADAIVPHVSALQDLKRGGRYDLSDFRIRCFTPEMIYGIVQAWEKWPFKPPVSHMAAMSQDLFKNRG